MSAQVTPQFASADPAANPLDLVALVNYLNTLFLTVNVQGGPFTPYVISNTTPAVGDQDKTWLQTDANGRPLAIKLFYSGAWRKFYTGLLSETRIFSGDPAIYFSGTGLGLSTPTEPNWDGWALCNGQNGTPNLSNLFIVGGAMDNAGITGYAGHWQTNVAGGALQTGGSSNYSIKNTDLPKMVINVTGQKYDSNTNASDDRVIVTNNHSAVTKTDLNPIASFGADPTGSPAVPQTQVATIPPFYALAYAKFVGYA